MRLLLRHGLAPHRQLLAQVDAQRADDAVALREERGPRRAERALDQPARFGAGVYRLRHADRAQLALALGARVGVFIAHLPRGGDPIGV